MSTSTKGTSILLPDNAEKCITFDLGASINKMSGGGFSKFQKLYYPRKSFPEFYNFIKILKYFVKKEGFEIL